MTNTNRGPTEDPHRICRDLPEEFEKEFTEESETTNRGLPEDPHRLTEKSQSIHREFTEDLQKTHKNSQRIRGALTEDLQRTHRGLTVDPQRPHHRGIHKGIHRGPTEDSQRTAGITEGPQSTHRRVTKALQRTQDTVLGGGLKAIKTNKKHTPNTSITAARYRSASI